MATTTAVKIDKLLRVSCQRNPNYKTIGLLAILPHIHVQCTRVKVNNWYAVVIELRREIETFGVRNVSSAYRTTCTSCISWSDVLKTGATQTVSTYGMMAMSRITIRHTGQCVDCGEDWDVEAASCDQGTVFVAAFLRGGRSRRLTCYLLMSG